jgi:hypothetical protein
LQTRNKYDICASIHHFVFYMLLVYVVNNLLFEKAGKQCEHGKKYK